MTLEQENNIEQLALLKETSDNVIFLASVCKTSIKDFCETVAYMARAFRDQVLNLQPVNELEYE